MGTVAASLRVLYRINLFIKSVLQKNSIPHIFAVTVLIRMYVIILQSLEIVKPIAALLSDLDQGPFRTLIVDSVIGKKKTLYTVCICVKDSFPFQTLRHFITSTIPRRVFWERGALGATAEGTERLQCSYALSTLMSEYLNRKLGKHLGQLVRIAEEFNVAVVLINQCMADPGALSMFVSLHSTMSPRLLFIETKHTIFSIPRDPSSNPSEATCWPTQAPLESC